MKTSLVTLSITRDERIHDAPEKWDWPSLTDLDAESVKVVSTVDDADQVAQALAALFKRIDGINDNWDNTKSGSNLAQATNDLNDQRAFTEALLVRVGLLTGKKET
jgi:hypothetical protein